MQWKVRKTIFMVSWQMNSSDDEKRCHHLPSRGRKKSASCSHLFITRKKNSCSYSNWILIVQSAITQLTSENSTKEDLTQYKRVDVQEYTFASVNTDAHNKLHIYDQINLKRFAIILPVYCTMIHVFYRHGHSS